VEVDPLLVGTSPELSADNGLTTQTLTGGMNMTTGTLVLTGRTVAENSDNGDFIGTLSVSGAAEGETFTYTLDSAYSDRFEIVGDELRVKAGNLLNFESTLKSFALLISATSQAEPGSRTNVGAQSFTINVTDVNEAPTGLTVTGGTVEDNAAAGTVVATLAGVDPDANETFSYILTDASGTYLTSDLFEIVNNQIV
jgi:hypothetical protein